MTLLIRLVVNAVAVAVAAWLLPGIAVQGQSTSYRVLTLAIVAAIFGLINAIVKPIAKLLSLPLIILTLGLLLFVINALMLLLTSFIADQLNVGFKVDGFVTALIGALIISIVSMVLNWVIPDKYDKK